MLKSTAQLKKENRTIEYNEYYNHELQLMVNKKVYNPIRRTGVEVLISSPFFLAKYFSKERW